jgi:hypothetical protein
LRGRKGGCIGLSSAKERALTVIESTEGLTRESKSQIHDVATHSG